MTKIPLNQQQYNYLTMLFSEENAGGVAHLSLPDYVKHTYTYVETELFDSIRENILSADNQPYMIAYNDQIEFITEWLHNIESDIVVNGGVETVSMENVKALTFVCKLIDYIEQYQLVAA